MRQRVTPYTMLEDCERNASNLSHWAQSKLDTIRYFVEIGRELSPEQIDEIERIHRQVANS